MTIQLASLPLPGSADAEKLKEFGREVKGVNPAQLSESEFQVIENLLHKHSVLLFRGVDMTPEEQHALMKAFDPGAESYGHGNKKVDSTKSSILHPYLQGIPRVPQVQLIGNSAVYNHEGITEANLKHAHHKSFHKTRVSDEDENRGFTRFFRWHMDAALYDLSPPKATTLYALKVPQGPPQTVRYDDGTGDELPVPLGTTAFTSGTNTFNLLSPALKSLAIRSRVRYAPHPFVWMAPARALPTGLGLESEGREVPLNELSEWEESKVKTYPMVWKNPVTEALHFQVHGCAATELLVDAMPSGKSNGGALYPDGAHLKDLAEVRRIIYEMQRPGIAPGLVYPHDWHEKDLIIFHNRSVLHSVVGTLMPDQVRVFHQCNLAASDDPQGPSQEDIHRFA